MLSEYFEQFSICSASDQLFMIFVVTENGQVSEERLHDFPLSRKSQGRNTCIDCVNGFISKLWPVSN